MSAIPIHVTSGLFVFLPEKGSPARKYAFGVWTGIATGLSFFRLLKNTLIHTHE